MIQAKNEILSFHPDIIKCFAIQNKGKFFALASEMSLKFGILEGETPQNFNFVQLPAKEGPKRHINSLIWSPSDEILAAISEVVTLWKFEKGAFKVISDFREQCIDITSSSWSPNSDFLATGYINGTVIIRKIDNGEVRHKFNIEGKVLSIAWDPLDKYIVILKNDNSLYFYKTLDFNLISQKSLMISNSKMNMVLKREDRKISWSTDYKHILVPSLDDHILPIVSSISRNEFQTQFNLIGPFSSINCVKFNPFIFKELNDNLENDKAEQHNEENLFQILAMGDNDGNISIWKLPIYDQKLNDKPLMIFKTHADSNQLIEDICWAEDGLLMIAITLRKYLFLAYFEENCFGKKLSEEECNRVIESIYGIKAGEKRRVRVFKGTHNENKTESLKEIVAQVSVKQPVKVIYTEQSVTFKEGKKRIMPQIQKVILEEKEPENREEKNIEIANNNNIESKISNENIDKNEKSLEIILDMEEKKTENSSKEKIFKTHSENEKKEINSSLSLQKSNSRIDVEEAPKRLPKSSKDEEKPENPLKKGVTKQIVQKKKSKSKVQNSESRSSPERNLPKKKFITLKTSKGIIEIENKVSGGSMSSSAAIIRKAVIIEEGKKYIWNDCVPGNILIADANEEMIVYYTDAKTLHVVNHDRKILCLPLFVKDLILVCAGVSNYLAFCTKDFDVKLIDIGKQEAVVSENLKGIFKDGNFNGGISKLIVSKDGSFSVILSDFSIFSYNFGMKAWQKLSFRASIINGTESDMEKMFEADFFKYEETAVEALSKFYDRLFSSEEEFHGEIWMKRLYEAAQSEEKMRFFLQKNDIQNFLQENQRFISSLISANEISRLLKYLEESIINDFSIESLFLRRNGISKNEFLENVKDVLKSQRANDLLEEIELFCSH